MFFEEKSVRSPKYLFWLVQNLKQKQGILKMDRERNKINYV